MTITIDPDALSRCVGGSDDSRWGPAKYAAASAIVPGLMGVAVGGAGHGNNHRTRRLGAGLMGSVFAATVAIPVGLLALGIDHWKRQS